MSLDKPRPFLLLPSTLLVFSPAEDPVPGNRLSLSVHVLQAAAPAERRVHPGVPLQVLGPGHVHLQGALQPGGRRTVNYGKPSET